MVLSTGPHRQEAQLFAHLPSKSRPSATRTMGFVGGPCVCCQSGQWQPAGGLQVPQVKHLPMMLITLEYHCYLDSVAEWEEQGI